MVEAKITDPNVRSEDVWNETVAEYYDYEDRPVWEEREDGTVTAEMKQDCLDDLQEEYGYFAEAEALDAGSVDEESDDEAAADDEVGEALDGAVADVEEALETGEYDTRLAEVESREREGDDRKGVYDAIADRREARAEAEEPHAENDDNE